MARHQIPFSKWAANGYLTLTEGNVVDYRKVRADIRARVDHLGVVSKSLEIGYDPWNATETFQELERDGFTMVPIRQGYASLSPPSKELERLVLGSTPQAPLVRHGGHQVLRWNVDCVEVRQDDAGNIKPVKPDRRKSSKRIDGIPAALMAIDRLTRHQDAPVYRTAGF